jgi:hypothetical protein
MRRLKAFLLAELLGSLLCVGIIVFGTAVFMFLCQFVGFLPYSDRPGPGFYGWFPLRSLSEIGEAAWFQLSFALFAAPFLRLPFSSRCVSPRSTVGFSQCRLLWFSAS